MQSFVALCWVLVVVLVVISSLKIPTTVAPGPKITSHDFLATDLDSSHYVHTEVQQQIHGEKKY